MRVPLWFLGGSGNAKSGSLTERAARFKREIAERMNTRLAEGRAAMDRAREEAHLRRLREQEIARGAADYDDHGGGGADDDEQRLAEEREGLRLEQEQLEEAARLDRAEQARIDDENRRVADQQGW